MSPTDAHRIVQLFEAVVELPPARRREALVEALAGRDELRQEIEELLAADAQLEAPAAARRIGPYRLVRKLGEGGMSEVYLGLREDGELEQRVAIKLMRPEVSSTDMVRRFEIERQILASLDHPAIARLLDAGRTAEGLPYFVMEHIEGDPIDAYCDRHRLAVPERLQLFLQVCSAIQLAHQNLIVHRDVKPSNVLVTASGQAKLLDFGIAKLLNPGLMLRGDEPTAPWARLLTPEYASPEQLRGEPVTMVSDVYALGVLLYKLLTGSVPHRLTGVHSPETAPEAPSELVRRQTGVVLETPDLETLAAQRSTSPRALVRTLAGRLDTIVLKALSPEPRNRYPSTEQLAQELRSYLARAPSPTISGTVSRWWPASRSARWRGLWVGLIFALLAGVATQRLHRQSVRVKTLRAEIAAQETLADGAIATLEGLLEAAAPAAGGDNATGDELLDRTAEQIRADLADQPEAQANLLMKLGETFSRRGRYDAAAASFEAASKVREQHFGGESEMVAASLFAFADAEARQGNFVAAESFHREALQIRRKLQRAKSLMVAESLVATARVVLGQGHAASAEPLLLEALAIREKLLGSWDPQMAEVLSDLGHTVADLQSPSAAELLFLRAARIQRRHEDAVSWVAVANLVDQATSLWRQGQRERAQTLLLEIAQLEGRLCAEETAGLGASLRRLALAAREGGVAAGCQPAELPVSHLAYLIEGLALGLSELGDTASAQSLLAAPGRVRSEPNHPELLRADRATKPACVPDGGFAKLLQEPCCSGLGIPGTVVCTQPDDWGSTWASCRHVCGSRLVEGCVPSGGITDTLALTDCCSGKSVSGTTRCLQPADADTTWRTCVLTCA